MNKRDSIKGYLSIKISLYIVIVFFIGLVLGFFWGYTLTSTKAEQVAQKQKAKLLTPKIVQTIQNSPKVGEEYPKEEKNISKLITPAPKPIKQPYLIIILDDVAHSGQLEAIKKLPFAVTPSIFPPSKINMNTPKLAKGLKHYLIHLPLESGSTQMNSFYKTLFVQDPASKILKRVKDIRRLFPKAHYINNHTGSVFTSNYQAMYRLFGDLKKEGFIFIDSRTTSKTVVPKVSKAYHFPYIARDVFLDNVQDTKAILKQLKEAISIAKKRGYAIAIGHPHPTTLKALNEAKTLLKGIKPIYFDQFYRIYYGK